MQHFGAPTLQQSKAPNNSRVSVLCMIAHWALQAIKLKIQSIAAHGAWWHRHITARHVPAQAGYGVDTSWHRRIAEPARRPADPVQRKFIENPRQRGPDVLQSRGITALIYFCANSLQCWHIAGLTECIADRLQRRDMASLLRFGANSLPCWLIAAPLRCSPDALRRWRIAATIHCGARSLLRGRLT